MGKIGNRIFIPGSSKPPALIQKGFNHFREHDLLRNTFYCVGTLLSCKMSYCNYQTTEYFDRCPQCGAVASAKVINCDYNQKTKGFMVCPKCHNELTCRYGSIYTLREKAYILNQYMGLTDLRIDDI
jgi:hypothetical protein